MQFLILKLAKHTPLPSFSKLYSFCSEITYGSSVSVEGKLIESPGKGQKFELIAEKVTVCGKCDPEVCFIEISGVISH